MEELLDFSDLKPEGEEDDAETLKFTGRLSTLEEVRFLTVYFKLFVPSVVTMI